MVRIGSVLFDYQKIIQVRALLRLGSDARSAHSPYPRREAFLAGMVVIVISVPRFVRKTNRGRPLVQSAPNCRRASSMSCAFSLSGSMFIVVFEYFFFRF